LSDISFKTLIEVLPNLKHYAEFDQLCRILTILNLSTTDNDSKYNDIKNLFIELDVKKEGKLNVNFIKKIFTKLDSDAANAIMKLNITNKNFIEYSEWLSACCNKKEIFIDKNLRRVFDIIDIDKSGNISQQEIKDFLKGDKN